MHIDECNVIDVSNVIRLRAEYIDETCACSSSSHRAILAIAQYSSSINMDDIDQPHLGHAHNRVCASAPSRATCLPPHHTCAKEIFALLGKEGDRPLLSCGRVAALARRVTGLARARRKSVLAPSVV